MAGVNPGGISRSNIGITWGHGWMALLAKHTKLIILCLHAKKLIYHVINYATLSETGQIWGFWSYPGECMEGKAWNFACYMLMYLDHLQNWLVLGHGLLIFVILAVFWLSETGQIWGFRAFPGECMEGMAWNMVCWCILTTFRTGKIVVTVCRYF